jgi:hypothetical protein
MKKLIEFLKIDPVFGYFLRLFAKDKDGKYPLSTNLKMMHGINKISILMFIGALIVMIYRAYNRE